MALTRVSTSPFSDQHAGTSGLRRRVVDFSRPHYVENYVQSIFDELGGACEGSTLVLGGDGRYYGDVACSTILRLASGNGFGRVIVGLDGLLSTPVISHLVRTHDALCGIGLTASHNVGGASGDFGIKLNVLGGGPASSTFMDSVYSRSCSISSYTTSDSSVPPLSAIGVYDLDGLRIEVIDSVSPYISLLRDIFDFGVIRDLLSSDFGFCYDGLSGVTGPYARSLFVDELGVDISCLRNIAPDDSFGDLPPDPTPVRCSHLLDLARTSNLDFCCASDGDGDRHLVLSSSGFVSPSDSLAVLCSHASCVPGFSSGLSGIGRSFPTSRSVDKVALSLGVPVYETPVGWKHFVGLLDSGLISLCGEESGGFGSSYVREKDGLFSILMWLNIIGFRGLGIDALLREHWLSHGRHYVSRHDFAFTDSSTGSQVMSVISDRLGGLVGSSLLSGVVVSSGEFEYTDVESGVVSGGHGYYVDYDSGCRLLFRLSGTGSYGSTLRVYLERYGSLDDGLDFSLLTSDYLDLSDLVSLTGRSVPDLVV